MPRNLDDGARVLGAEGGEGVPIHALPAHDGIPLAFAHLVFAFKIELHGVGVRVAAFDFCRQSGGRSLSTNGPEMADAYGCHNSRDRRSRRPGVRKRVRDPRAGLAAYAHSLEHHALPAGMGRIRSSGAGWVEGVFGLHIVPCLERGVPRIGSEQAGGNQQDGIGTHYACLIELIFVNDEVFSQ